MREHLELAAATLLLGGCVSYIPVTQSAQSSGRQEIPLGAGSGRSEASYGPLSASGDDSVGAAVQDALLKAQGTGAEGLSDLVVERRQTCFPFCAMPVFRSVSTMVSGTLVKYRREAPAAAAAAVSTAPAPGVVLAAGGARPAATAKRLAVQTPEELYGTLFAKYAIKPAQAEAVYAALKALQRKRLEGYILDSKGEAAILDWEFRIAKGLDPREKAFLSWFLKAHTQYTPLE